MPTVLLVRHATTPTTGTRLYGRKRGVHINDAGIAQAEAAAAHLADTKLAAVYTSPMERARETAAIVARPHGIKPKVRAGLNEVDYGDWTDKTLVSLRKRKEWSVIQQTPSRFSFPGGESLLHASSRIAGAVEALAAAHKPKDTFVVVSHADLIRMLIAHFSGTPLDMFQRLMVAPASVTTIHLAPGADPFVVSTNVIPKPLQAQPRKSSDA
ncbi:MAG: putative phosphomutase (TIGR03848 family) [Glaciecola sp.]